MFAATVDSDPFLTTLSTALAVTGYLVIDEFLPPALAEALRDECIAEENSFSAAGTGRQQGYVQTTAARKDEICWLEGNTPATSDYFAWMEYLRSGLNERLVLGLFDYECHFARYAPGAYYRTHVDAFKGQRNRVLSTVLYLNPHWQEHEGGELVLYTPDKLTVLERVVPEANRLVIFLSEDFPHEVLPTRHTRYSLTGWFYVRGQSNLIGSSADESAAGLIKLL